ncbi:MAG: hypothetical protein HUU55_16050 [Myxococcales bacterium]|nr:hypothetical protein [Myxococcales bacterium]
MNESSHAVSQDTTGRGMIQIAAILHIIAVVLGLWGALDVRPIPVLMGLGVGAPLGILGVVLYVIAVIKILIKSRAL